MEAGHASGREGNGQMARRSTVTEVRAQTRYAVIVVTNNTANRGGLDTEVLRTEFFGTEAEAKARVSDYEAERTRINPTEAELLRFFPWHDDGREYFTFQCIIRQVDRYVPAADGFIYGWPTYRSLWIHEYR